MYKLINKFSESKVLIVGDIMIDSYWYGNASRISPEAPVPVVNIHKKEMKLGGAANVASNCAELKCETFLLGITGDDIESDYIEKLLKKKKIKFRINHSKEIKTIQKNRILVTNQQLMRIDIEDLKPYFEHQYLINNYSEILKQSNVVLFSDYKKGTLLKIVDMISLALANKKKIVVDPKGKDFNKYKGASIITPNFSEFEAVVGRCDSEKDIERKGWDLLTKLDLEALLITRSDKGMTLFERNHSVLNLPTKAKEVYDVTGAGDTVVACIAAALGSKINYRDAISISNIAAGIVVGKIGASSVTPEEIQINSDSFNNEFKKGIFTEKEILDIRKYSKLENKKIVMTNGCFDLLHPGHIDYLERAKKLGDILIVAVNTDDSVKRLKGKNRPINDINFRMTMLASLSCVDFVFSFQEDTPERIYSELLPDILAKGGDYLPNEVVGGNEVKKNGGEVVILDYLKGLSTSNIIEKIKTKE